MQPEWVRGMAESNWDDVCDVLVAGSGGGPAFALYFGDDAIVGPLRIRWALIGHNVNLDQSF